MFRYILLDCLHSMNAERTISGVFHLLRGKKSSQTFQDAKVYGIDRYYGIYPGLKRETVINILEKLEKDQAIQRVDESRVAVTEIGRGELNSHVETLHFSGMEYSEAVNEFQDRLLLWIQVLSNAVHHKEYYLPVVDGAAVQQWAKKLYIKEKKRLGYEGERLFHELIRILAGLSEMEKDLFVRRLTGGGDTGWTYDQLAESWAIPISDVPLYLKNTHYYLFFEAVKNPSSSLHKLTGDLVKKESLTASSKKSIRLFDEFQSLEEVAELRGLKTSTIEDHLVEAVLVDPERPIDAFIGESELEEIREVVQTIDTKRLKVIHDELDGRYSYFQLRMVLAKLQKG
ncbi:helix-turn-helix domain-containing protein [Salimicrobium sp. PL1-032A]|uniref:helix-turn-helix domain-containing protein n=1 Tax=Salimicrobium sp. PL1-032A TaxID=3095364 RepID=UPI00326141FE